MKYIVIQNTSSRLVISQDSAKIAARGFCAEAPAVHTLHSTPAKPTYILSLVSEIQDISGLGRGAGSGCKAESSTIFTVFFQSPSRKQHQLYCFSICTVCRSVLRIYWAWAEAIWHGNSCPVSNQRQTSDSSAKAVEQICSLQSHTEKADL